MSGYPEVMGEYPAAALAEEITHAGNDSIRALITVAGNPVLSVPNGDRLREAIEGLDFVVAIDIYANETTSLADVIKTLDLFVDPTYGLNLPLLIE